MNKQTNECQPCVLLIPLYQHITPCFCWSKNMCPYKIFNVKFLITCLILWNHYHLYGIMFVIWGQLNCDLKCQQVYHSKKPVSDCSEQYRKKFLRFFVTEYQFILFKSLYLGNNNISCQRKWFHRVLDFNNRSNVRLQSSDKVLPKYQK